MLEDVPGQGRRQAARERCNFRPGSRQSGTSCPQGPWRGPSSAIEQAISSRIGQFQGACLSWDGRMDTTRQRACEPDGETVFRLGRHEQTVINALYGAGPLSPIRVPARPRRRTGGSSSGGNRRLGFHSTHLEPPSSGVTARCTVRRSRSSHFHCNWGALQTCPILD